MSCIEPQDVRNVLPAGVVLSDPAIAAAIISAQCTLEEIEDCIAGKSETCKAQIAIYLAAHYAAVTDNTLSIQSEKDGCADSSVTYGFKFGTGIKGTPFGQTANTLSGGCLAELDKAPAGLFSIGSC